MSWRTYRAHFAEVVNDAGAVGAVLWISDMDIRPPVLWKTPAVYWFQNLPRLLWWFPLLCARVNSEPCNYNVINCHSNHWSVRSHRSSQYAIGCILRGPFSGRLLSCNSSIHSIPICCEPIGAARPGMLLVVTPVVHKRTKWHAAGWNCRFLSVCWHGGWW
jgi:hypothetical protein